MNKNSPFRKDFPIFENHFDKKKIVYFDSAATTLKPKTVISAITNFYEYETSNVYRGSHSISENNTLAFEQSREKIASFIKAEPQEIVFTNNCTEAINLISLGLELKNEDEVIVSVLEHHSNYLPWMQNNLKVIDIDTSGQIDLHKLEQAITNQTKLIAITYVSNVTGNIQPIEEVIKLAKKYGILTLIDASQAVAHFPVNVKNLDCDFMVFSAHKMFGPSGVGILYGKKEMLSKLKPSKLGGGMVNRITPSDISFKSIPHLFEAGTPNIEGVIGFGKAIDYLNEKGFSSIISHLDYLESYLRTSLQKLDFIELPFIISKKHIPIFIIRPKNPNIDVSFITRILSNSYQIVLREGYHCAQPLFNHHSLSGAIRISLQIYNSTQDIDMFIKALKEACSFFQ